MISFYIISFAKLAIDGKIITKVDLCKYLNKSCKTFGFQFFLLHCYQKIVLIKIVALDK